MLNGEVLADYEALADGDVVGIGPLRSISRLREAP